MRHPLKIFQGGQWFKYGVMDFHMGDRKTVLSIIRKPVVPTKSLFGNVSPFWHPSVPVSKDTEKKRTASVNLAQTDVDNLPRLRFLPGHTPAKININDVKAVLFTPLPQIGKHVLDQ